jgi:hypothetical protein
MTLPQGSLESLDAGEPKAGVRTHDADGAEAESNDHANP